MKNLLIPALLSALCFGCKGKGSQNKHTGEDTAHFFQTAVIIQHDIKEMDSIPYYIYKLQNIQGKKDSATIKVANFKQLAQNFLHPDISSEALKPQYKQSIFEDLTIGGFTISYTTLNKDLEVQSIHVLLKEDGKTVKNIFIRKFFTYGSDSSAIEQLTWKPAERFQIIRSVQKKDNSEINYQTTVVWNDKSLGGK